MFVRKSTYDAMHAEAKACSAMAIALAEELNKAIAERDDSRRRHAITEMDACNQASRANDLQRQLDALKPARDAKGKFAPTGQIATRSAPAIDAVLSGGDHG